MSLTPGAREAAEIAATAFMLRTKERLAPHDGTWWPDDLYDAFLAGYSAALSPPTPEEIEAVRNALNERGVDANDNEAISAINRFLEERKR
jgi:hypothetical protein